MQFYHDKGFIYISHEYKLIFIPIPKNGSTSIRKLEQFNFKQDSIFKYINQIDNGKYHVFTILRDPITRFLSGYIEANLRGYNNTHKKYVWIKNQKLRFYTFIEELENEIFVPHLFQQSYLLTDFDGNYFKINKYINFENYEDEILHYFKTLGYNIKLLREKRYRSSSGKVTIGKILMGFKKIINSFFQGKNSPKLYDSRRLLYQYSLFLINYLFFTRHLCKKEYIAKLMYDDCSIINRVKKLYNDDYELIKKLGL